MKISVNSYSFNSLLKSGSMALTQCVESAKELGFDAIDFTELMPREGMTPLELAKALRQRAGDAGIEILNYTVGADFLTGSGGDIGSEIDRVKRQVDIAAELGVKLVRHDASSGFPPGERALKSFDDALPRLAQGCFQVSEYAAGMGIKTMVENHGFFCQDSERVQKLISQTAHPNFGWLVDIGNFLCADEDPAVAVAIAAPHAFYVHAKDFHIRSGMLPSPGKGFFRSRAGNYLRGAIIGHGEVPVPQCLSILFKAGYSGPVSVEFEGLENPMTGLEIGIENLRRYILLAQE
ncbi:MAG: sugar phosphate isomerase/epimerase family protein [Christensenellales bacterium]|jgi:sugar phosphate isomerase/epimerase